MNLGVAECKSDTLFIGQIYEQILYFMQCLWRINLVLLLLPLNIHIYARSFCR